MYPFTVLMLGIKCLSTISFVRPGHVVRWLLWMSLTKFGLTVENNAVFRNFTKFALVSFLLMMTDMFGEDTWNYLNEAVLICSILSFFSVISTK